MIDFARLHSPDSEQAVLGALLLPGSNAVDRIGQLKPGHFFTEAHRIIFGEIVAMAAQAIAIDPVTVAERLDVAGLSEKTGGLAYLGELSLNTPSAANIGRYAQTVVDKALERELLAASEQIQAIASGVGPTKDKLAAAQSAIMAITESAEPKKPKLIREVLIRAVATIERRGDGTDNAMSTGFDAIDKKLSGGLRHPNLVIVAARPGMGKTALAGCVALNTASNGTPTLFLSMEMADIELADRLIAIAGRVPLDDILAGNMNGDAGDRILAGTARLHELPLLIDEQGGLSFFDVASKARSVKRQHGLGLLIIDYLQLMVGDGDSRNSQIEGITRGLKALAKELEIPIIALSQLSRNCESRPNKRPMLSDLRESGAIEQDADIVLMCYRDEYYNPSSPDAGTAEIIVAKNRQGSTGMARLAYIAPQTRFETLDSTWRPAPVEQPFAQKNRKGFSA
ncbi:MAG: replicative DNA helicase [Gammaproteobacteria bacterium]|nr:replicative DNA helicase [Gammaproteobacteria bacterium]MBU1602375.1 replicative DNA helicase [Gammaproteobacteria bacterium]MBU2433180.1 replicative DNA helicase [Gammaproteobacteria bacterium]MBU2451096.1 replicative DNA helicase [Gammaproteobacteria bacterium]